MRVTFIHFVPGLKKRQLSTGLNRYSRLRIPILDWKLKQKQRSPLYYYGITLNSSTSQRYLLFPTLDRNEFLLLFTNRVNIVTLIEMNDLLLQILTFAKFGNSSLSVQIGNIKAAWRQYSHRQPSVNYAVFFICC